MTLQEKNTEICKCYKAAYEKEHPNDEGKSKKDLINRICFDGLIYNGEPLYEDEAWSRESDTEEEIWIQSDIRPLFLTKRPNDVKGWDMRQETGLDNNYDKKVIGVRFYRNIMYWLYGLMNMREDGSYPKFHLIDDDELIRSFDTNPIARINIDKEIGKCTDDETLSEAIKKYGKYVKSQIKLLQPNIIFCCDGSPAEKNPMMNFLYQMYNALKPYESIYKRNEKWIYHNLNHDTIIVHAYSPKYWGLGYECLYCKTMREIAYILPKTSLSKFDINKLQNELNKKL